RGGGAVCARTGRPGKDQPVRMRGIRYAVAALAVLATVGVAGCGAAQPAGGGQTGGGQTSGGGQAATTPAAVSGTVTAFAAASLTEAFTRIGKDFEAANPGSTVTFNFAASSALANQINQGAPADVFASAAPANMKTVTDAGNGDGTPTTFVRNQLVIAVPKGN